LKTKEFGPNCRAKRFLFKGLERERELRNWFNQFILTLGKES
jgi:hypothetical protein